MDEYLLEAREELKRLEHIIYVSLKYTRTVDVILNALKRIVETYNFIIESYLERAKDQGLIDMIPKSPALRATRLDELYPEDKELTKYLDFYKFLKMVLKTPHEKIREYRRHVALIFEHNNQTISINIDNLMNAQKFIHKFFTYAWHDIVGLPDEDDE
ncbi:MAG: hypothetical protein ACTSYA_07050 [Candidatus Kariarchaeaceae archaeon]